MPIRLTGAKARFIERNGNRSATGQIKSVIGADLVVSWPEPIKPPFGGACNIIAFAEDEEYSVQATTLSSTPHETKLRIISEIRELPVGRSVRLLNEPTSAICQLGGRKLQLQIIAASEDAFAFESDDILPMDDTALFVMVSNDQEFPLNASLILQRFGAGANRGLAQLSNLDRVTKMHWNRLIKV